MPDLDQRLRGLDRVSAPDLWGRIQKHEPRRPVPDGDQKRASRLLTAIVAIVVAAAGIAVAVKAFSNHPSPPPVDRVPTPQGSLIIFTTQSIPFDPTPVIAVMRSDGTGIRRLVPGTDPSWSPDGTKIAFSCGTPMAICVMDATGRNVQTITEPPESGFDEDPAWGQESIAFTRTYSAEQGAKGRDIFTVAPDGTHLRKLTGDPSDDFEPNWAPDGSRLAFVRIPDPARVAAPGAVRREDINQIWIMGTDGSAAQRLTDEAAGAWRPAWSPDGSLIAFDEDSAIFVVSPDGTGIRQLEPGTTGLSPDGLGAFPEWSADGQEIVFMCGNPDTNHDICVMSADGTGRRSLTTGPENEGSPAWQPAGERASPTFPASPSASTGPSALTVVGTLPFSPQDSTLFTTTGGSLFVAKWGPGEPAGIFTFVRVDSGGAPHEHQVAFDLVDYLAKMSASPDGVYLGTNVIKRFSNADDQLLRIDPGGGRIVVRAAFPAAIAPLATDSGLWASLGDGRILRLDPKTLAVEASRQLVPRDVALATGAPLSKPALGLGSLWVLSEKPSDLELVRLDPVTLAVLSGSRMPATGGLAESLNRVIADDQHVYMIGSAIQDVDADGGLVGPPIPVPGLLVAEIHGDGVLGIIYLDGPPSLVLLGPDGSIAQELELVDGGGDLVVDGDDMWFLGDAGGGNGIVHARASA